MRTQKRGRSESVPGLGRLLYATPKGRGIGKAAQLLRGAIELGQGEGRAPCKGNEVLWRPGLRASSGEIRGGS